MSGFDDREAAWEKKIELDADFRFKVMVQRDKMIARWAAAKLSMDEADIDDYATSVVKADLEEAGDDDIVRKLMGDFTVKGVEMTEDEIRRQLEVLERAAAEELHNKA
jgi:hypothetical protein